MWTRCVGHCQHLLDEVQKLKSLLPRTTPESVVAFIDERCTEHCNHFADEREQLKSVFGLIGFGEVMSEFASGERFLNRTWSAAAEGYMEEAYRFVETSLRFSQAAQERIKNSEEPIPKGVLRCRHLTQGYATAEEDNGI